MRELRGERSDQHRVNVVFVQEAQNARHLLMKQRILLFLAPSSVDDLFWYGSAIGIQYVALDNELDVRCDALEQHHQLFRATQETILDLHYVIVDLLCVCCLAAVAG
jgi:hypothetical protein